MYEPIPTNAQQKSRRRRWLLALAALLGLAIGYEGYVDYWTRYPVLAYSKRAACPPAHLLPVLRPST